MTDTRVQSWTNAPYAPKVPYEIYLHEKATFVGNLVGSILYGIAIVLFFNCMATLFDPIHRRGEGIRWRLLSYTVVMFSLITVKTAMNLNTQSISFIDNREFLGGKGGPPGPYGYQRFLGPHVIRIIPNAMFPLTNWLADGLLLYRCYVIYKRNLWVIAFPCFMFLGSVGIGTVFLYQTSRPAISAWAANANKFGTPYLSISISLNILLTLMIVTRLVLHTRNNRAALGASGGIGGLYKAIVTVLIESCALYAVSSLLIVAPKTSVVEAFLPILYETQVIAPLLIVQRVANRSALTSGSGRALPNVSPVGFADMRGGNSDGLGAEVKTTIDIHRGEAGGS